MKLAFILRFGVVFGGFVSDLLENYDSREKPEELEVIKCIPQIYWLYDIEATESKFRKIFNLYDIFEIGNKVFH